MTAEIIGIGDELLYGQTLNSNASYIAARLIESGVEVRHMTTIGDDAESMLDAFSRAMARVDIVITTGGLGPTPDDFTQRVVAQFFGLEIREFPELLNEVRTKYEAFGRPMPDFARNQAWFPVGANRISNPIGTAYGIDIDRDGKRFFALPGVPSEAIWMMDHYISRVVLALPKEQYIAVSNVRTIGWGETQIQQRLGEVGLKQIADAGCGLAFLPKHGLVDLRLTARGNTPEAAQQKLALAKPVLLQATDDIRYSDANESLVEVLQKLMREKKLTFAVAESCTGGALAAEFTQVPGSSDVFNGGAVTYSNSSKIELLGVSSATLNNCGSVSTECAVEMAKGALNRFQADIALSITGISGPSGGTSDKPVGTVCIGLARKSNTQVLVKAHRYLFPGTRDVHRLRTIGKAWYLLWRELREV